MSSVETIRQIEQHLGLNSKSSPGDSPLEVWYERIRDKPLAEFTDGDLAKCCRQELYLEFVLPFAVRRIEVDPLAGEMYDGELLAALAGISSAFWMEHQSLSDRLCDVLSRAIPTDDERLLITIHTLRKRIGSGEQ